MLDGIGSTEALHIFCSNHPGDVRPGSTGRPMEGYVLQINSRPRTATGKIQRFALRALLEAAVPAG
jgi:acyl-coenzyme A synthetase/AMP-(fatty) acid ligase